MANPSESPAVQSLKNERARQAEKSNRGELDRALEGTFPASDPVSVSNTSVVSGRADTDLAARVAQGDDNSSEVSAPLVDEALDAKGEGRYSGDDSAYRKEAERITESVSDFAYGSKEVAKSKAMDVVRQIEDYARAKPLKAVAIAGAVAFLFGLTR